MFTQLQDLLKSCSNLTLMVVPNSNNTLSVTVLPKSKLTGDDAKALSTPLSLTATAEELDEGFIDVLKQYVESHSSLAEQLETTKTILDAANKESQGKATKAISKASTTAKATPAPAPVTKGEGEDVEVVSDDGDDDTNVAHDQETSTTTQSEAAPAAAVPNLWS